jgi:hypothetical protein
MKKWGSKALWGVLAIAFVVSVISMISSEKADVQQATKECEAYGDGAVYIPEAGMCARPVDGWVNR